LYRQQRWRRTLAAGPMASRFLVDTLTPVNADVETLTVGINYLFKRGTVAPIVSRY
jgi:hypothetical protein